MYDFQVSEDLRRIFKKLEKREKIRYLAAMKKIEEIVHSADIGHYKNLRYNLSDFKRVHIDSHFALVFKVYNNNNLIVFVDLQYHDIIYKR